MLNATPESRRITLENGRHCYSNGSSVPNSPSSNEVLQVIPSWSDKYFSREKFNVLTTTTSITASGSTTTTTKSSWYRHYVNFSVYISVYCLSDCSYDLDIRAQGSYLPDTCGGTMGLSKPNNGLCCPYNGCNSRGVCVIDYDKKEPICKCDSGYSGVGCENENIIVTNSLATYGIYIGGLLALATVVVCCSFVIMNTFMASLIPQSKKKI